MKGKTTIYLAFVMAAVLLAVFLVVNRDTSGAFGPDEKPDFEMSAAQLIAAFEADEVRADSMYGGKVLELHGRLSQVIEDGSTKIWMIGDSVSPVGVSCYLEAGDADVIAVKPGDEVRVKGVCNGMLSDIVLGNTIVIAKE